MLEDYASIFNKRKLFLRFNGLQKAFFEKIKNIKIEGKIAEKRRLFDHYFAEYKYHFLSIMSAIPN